MKDLFSVVGSGLRIPTTTFDVVLHYIRHYQTANEQLIKTYLKEQGTSGDDKVVEDMLVAIKDASDVARQIELLQSQVDTIYRWNFYQIAEVLRAVRMHLELDDIRKMYSLRVVTDAMAHMLAEDSAKFSTEKFITYINTEETPERG